MKIIGTQSQMDTCRQRRGEAYMLAIAAAITPDGEGGYWIDQDHPDWKAANPPQPCPRCYTPWDGHKCHKCQHCNGCGA